MIKAWMQAKTLCPWTMQRALHAQNQRLKASTTTTALLRIVSFAYQPDNIGGFHGLNATYSGWQCEPEPASISPHPVSEILPIESRSPRPAFNFGWKNIDLNQVRHYVSTYK
jgi:hypothetical protein